VQIPANSPQLRHWNRTQFLMPQQSRERTQPAAYIWIRIHPAHVRTVLAGASLTRSKAAEEIWNSACAVIGASAVSWRTSRRQCVPIAVRLA